MAKRSHPRRGSMAFSPRKRANRQFGRVKSWASTDSGEIRVQGFVGWKAGMTHVLLRDTNPNSNSAGQEVRKPVTVIEIPALRILGVRAYGDSPYGLQTIGEVWWDCDEIKETFPELFRRVPIRKEHDSESHKEQLLNSDYCEVRLIVATNPKSLSSIPSKTPEIMEMGLSGGDLSSQLEWSFEKLGSELEMNSVFETGSQVDVIGITKGYGWQGVIRRFGGKLQSHKNSKKIRQHGNMGDFGTGYVRKTIRQGGQTGFHQRTEFNKRILKISHPEEDEITPSGGFLHYGEVRNSYVLIEGSVPGPAKRLVRFRDAVRPRKKSYPVEITYVSTASKQGA